MVSCVASFTTSCVLVITGEDWVSTAQAGPPTPFKHRRATAESKRQKAEGSGRKKHMCVDIRRSRCLLPPAFCLLALEDAHHVINLNLGLSPLWQECRGGDLFLHPLDARLAQKLLIAVDRDDIANLHDIPA